MEGAIIGGKYKLGKAIGSGAFGMVRIATDIQNTCEVAVKIYVREMIKIKKMEEFGLYYLFLHAYKMFAYSFLFTIEFLFIFFTFKLV